MGIMNFILCQIFYQTRERRGRGGGRKGENGNSFFWIKFFFCNDLMIENKR